MGRYTNPFEGLSEPLPPSLTSDQWRHGHVDVGAGVRLGVVRGPAGGRPLVMLPAQMGTWRTYLKVMPQLARTFEVIAVDVTGHGTSTWTPGRYDWPTVGAQLAELIGKTCGQPAIVSGNSSGGILALWLAAERPDVVAGIVLEDAPVFSVEMPRFRDRDRFVYRGLEHAVDVLGDLESRDLADYFRGQELPVSARRVKRMPNWVIDRLLSPGVRRYAKRHPGEPAGFSAWWAPPSFGDLFRSLSMFDADFARAFIDGRMYADFSHADALRATRVPILLQHGKWMRIEPYGLVGALDDDDVARVVDIAPQTRVVDIDANHVLHRYKPTAFMDSVEHWARDELTPA